MQAYLRQCSECLLSIYKYHDSKLTCKTQRGTSPTSCTLVDTLAGPSEILMIIRCSPGCVFHWSKTLSIPREAMEYWEQDLSESCEVKEKAGPCSYLMTVQDLYTVYEHCFLLHHVPTKQVLFAVAVL